MTIAPNSALQDEDSAVRAALIFARSVGLIAVAFGLAVLAGWHFEEALLKQGFPSSLTMTPNSAAGFVLAGLGLLALSWRLSRPLARLLGLVLIAGAAATLSQDVMGWNLDIDQILLTVHPLQPEAAWPGRMSPGAALAFILIGLVLLCAASNTWILIFITEFMLVAIIVLAITNLISHSYEITQRYNPFPFTAMPVHMGVMLALLAAGLSAAMPDRGFVRAVLDPSAGGQMIRRLLPGMIVIPVLLGWMVHRGLVLGIYSNAVGTALFAVSSIVVMTGFSWLTSVALRRADSERQLALVELHGQRESLRATLASIADAVMATDDNGSVMIMNPVAERLTGWTFEEARAAPVREVFRIADEATLKPVEDPTLTAQRDKEVVALADNILIRKDGNRIPIEHTTSPILSTRGRVAGAVLIFRDITGRRLVEEQQEMVVGELNHRVRNLLMIVQSLVQASAQHTEGKSAAEMSKVLADRLQSLGRAHELLLDTQWSGASLKQLVERELEPFRHDGSRKVTIRGKDVLLPPQCTSVVAMALHELTTNAAKYGALAVPEGTLNVNWAAKGPRLTINWTERNVDMKQKREMAPNRKSGFGMRLIDKGIRKNLGGDTNLEFREDGLAVVMKIPLSDQPSAKPPRLRRNQSA